MENTMNKQKDFLDQLLELMQANASRQDKRMDSLESKIDANSRTTEQVLEQAKYTNGRVNKVEADMRTAQKDIRHLESSKGKKLPLEPRTMYLLALGFVLLLAFLLHINVGGIL